MTIDCLKAFDQSLAITSPSFDQSPGALGPPTGLVTPTGLPVVEQKPSPLSGGLSPQVRVCLSVSVFVWVCLE